MVGTTALSVPRIWEPGDPFVLGCLDSAGSSTESPCPGKSLHRPQWFKGSKPPVCSGGDGCFCCVCSGCPPLSWSQSQITLQVSGRFFPVLPLTVSSQAPACPRTPSPSCFQGPQSLSCANVSAPHCGLGSQAGPLCSRQSNSEAQRPFWGPGQLTWPGKRPHRLPCSSLSMLRQGLTLSKIIYWLIPHCTW